MGLDMSDISEATGDAGIAEPVAGPLDQHQIEALSAQWRSERNERQMRRHLEPRDFTALRDAGLWASVVPEADGGPWRNERESARPICDALRHLGRGDPSVALVASMHPSVIAFWLANPDPTQPDWEAQRKAVFAAAAAGDQWGTITSEPGSGGDITRTRSQAVLDDGPRALPGRPYLVTGDKHFGSGMGVTDWMMTTALPEGETEPAIFVLDVRDRPWDGSAGLELVAEWDGMGMAATQSHAMRLDNAPAVRFGLDKPLDQITLSTGSFIAAVFTAVVMGVLDEAISTARQQLQPKADALRAFEQVEWARAERDHWVARQAYEGALRVLETGDQLTAIHAALRAKEAVAELAEDTLRRLSRVIGGGTFSQRSPFAHWFEDVRALGFLRPPWGLAFDLLFATSWLDT
jgi:alkylation response protein AidB-like acyl-CoA dehydrogenase